MYRNEKRFASLLVRLSEKVCFARRPIRTIFGGTDTPNAVRLISVWTKHR